MNNMRLRLVFFVKVDNEKGYVITLPLVDLVVRERTEIIDIFSEISLALSLYSRWACGLAFF